jgi:endo-1,4-beta-xylanase
VAWGHLANGDSTAVSVDWVASGGAIEDGSFTGAARGVYRLRAVLRTPAHLEDSVTVTVGTALPPPPLPAQTLRALATARGFEIGAAVRDTPFVRDPDYRALLSAQYNSIGTEDATDMYTIFARPMTYDFARADRLVAYAQAQGIPIHGHTLIWGSFIPGWITSGNYSRTQLYTLMRDYITTVVTRYRGKVASWDVLNEMLDNWPGTTVKPSFWLDRMGPAYMDSALVWAHRADPGVGLYVNEYLAEFPGAKSDFFFSLVQGFRARGIPLHGVAFQMHVTAGRPTWPGYSIYSQNPIGTEFHATLTRFANAGYDIRITELDVEVADSDGPLALEKQGQIYRDVLDGCLRVSRCKELTMWGITDKYHWLPVWRPGFGRALPIDANYQPKPAFDSLLARMGRPQ